MLRGGRDFMDTVVVFQAEGLINFLFQEAKLS